MSKQEGKTVEGKVRFVIQAVDESMQPLDVAPQFYTQKLYNDRSEALRDAKKYSQDGFEYDVYELRIRKIGRIDRDGDIVEWQAKKA